MSDNRDFGLNIDDILAEFSSFSSHLVEETVSEPVAEEPAPAEEAVYEAPAPVEEVAYEAPEYESLFEEPVYTPEPVAEEAPAVEKVEPVEAPPRRASLSGIKRSREIDPELLGYRRGGGKEKAKHSEPATEEEKPKAKKLSLPKREKPETKLKPEKPVSKPKFEKKAKSEKPAIIKEEKPAKSVKNLVGMILTNVVGTVFAAISVIVLGWLLFNVHPESGAVTNATTQANLDLVGKLDVFMNNAASDALGDLAYIKKIYTIDESAFVAPKPIPTSYGKTTNPADIDAVIEKAKDLIGDQTLTWDPTVDFYPGSEINYYLDDTILVIAWKEIRENKVCTCSEVIIAHGSQLRRKLAGDAYGSSVQLYASQMATDANSVIAINGDFYAFRDLGITGYQRQIYRVNPASVDSCFFTADGDMLFAYAGELMGEGEAQKFMDDNNCTFCIAFGPVLVDNGQLRTVEAYPIGEINTTYSRAAIGQLGERHYFLMTINYEGDYNKTSTIHQLGEFMYQKGCTKAYTLDGGQTSVMVMQGQTLNKVDWGTERIMSDIIYFATAIPEEEVAR